MVESRSFVALADERDRHVWEAIFTMPFIVELGAGALDLESFACFIREDRLYLDRFSKALALGSVHAQDHDVRHFFLQRSAAAMGSEEGFHTSFAGRLGFDLAEIRSREPAPVTLAYTDHMLRVALPGPLAELVAVVLPCYLVYKRVGQRLAGNLPQHEIYRAWIQGYSRPEFAANVDRQCALADRLYAEADEQTRARMNLWFDRSLRYEWMFWDQAYHKRGWPAELTERAGAPVAVTP